MESKISEKAWNPELEKNILKQWEEDKIYNFTPKENNFTIDTPPPYPSGRPWHIGAAAHYSQIDMIARTARMAGKNVYFFSPDNFKANPLTPKVIIIFLNFWSFLSYIILLWSTLINFIAYFSSQLIIFILNSLC